MAQEQINISIPKTCQECYGSDFQLPRPHCPYDKAIKLRDSVKFFKEQLDMDLQINVNAFFIEIKPQVKACLDTIGKRAESIILEKQKEQRITEQNQKNEKMEKQLDELSAMVKQVINNQNPDTIFKPEHIETETKTVHKDPKMTFQKSDPGKMINMKKPTGPWLRYQRNVKRENVPKYLKKLKDLHPELSAGVDKVLAGKPSDVVKIGKNKAGRSMIDYKNIV